MAIVCEGTKDGHRGTSLTRDIVLDHTDSYRRCLSSSAHSNRHHHMLDWHDDSKDKTIGSQAIGSRVPQQSVHRDTDREPRYDITAGGSVWSGKVVNSVPRAETVERETSWTTAARKYRSDPRLMDGHNDSYHAMATNR